MCVCVCEHAAAQSSAEAQGSTHESVLVNSVPRSSAVCVVRGGRAGVRWSRRESLLRASLRAVLNLSACLGR